MSHVQIVDRLLKTQPAILCDELIKPPFVGANPTVLAYARRRQAVSQRQNLSIVSCFYLGVAKLVSRRAWDAENFIAGSSPATQTMQTGQAVKS